VETPPVTISQVSCEKIRRDKITAEAQKTFFSKKSVDELMWGSSMQIPIPEKYPVTFDEFLRLTVGGKYKSNRYKTFRAYVTDMVWLGHVRELAYPKNPNDKISIEEAEKKALPASLDEIESWIKSEKDRLIETEDQFRASARAFLEWKKKQPSERGKNAAAKRWQKEKKVDEALKKP
jgi:hypothetical protein